jgi:hypothetical protein
MGIPTHIRIKHGQKWLIKNQKSIAPVQPVQPNKKVEPDNIGKNKDPVIRTSSRKKTMINRYTA